MTAPKVTQRDVPITDRILVALDRVPAGLTSRQLVLALGYAQTDEQQVESALRSLRACWSVETYHRSVPGDVVLVWQHRRYSTAHRILIVTQEAA